MMGKVTHRHRGIDKQNIEHLKKQIDGGAISDKQVQKSDCVEFLAPDTFDFLWECQKYVIDS